MLFDQIIKAIENLNSDTVTEDRKTVLNDLIEYIQDKKNLDEVCHINFICTHNSRRSHLAQIWAQTCAAFYNIPKLFCFSGGTKATKLYQTIKDTLEEQGFIFKIEKHLVAGHHLELNCDRQNINSSHKILSWITFLNDIDDDEGNFVFNYLNLSVKPKKGTTLIFPSDWTHLHKQNIMKNNEKFTIRGSFHFPDTIDSED